MTLSKSTPPSSFALTSTDYLLAVLSSLAYSYGLAKPIIDVLYFAYKAVYLLKVPFEHMLDFTAWLLWPPKKQSMSPDYPDGLITDLVL